MIKTMAAVYPCDVACEALEVSRSAYYEHLNQREHKSVPDITLRAKLTEFFNQSRGAAGSRPLVLRLGEAGFKVGRYKVPSLMKSMGLVSKQPGGKHRYAQNSEERPDLPNILNRQFSPQRPNQAWVSDITFIWTGERWAYLAVVMDLYARRVIGWAISLKADALLVITALDMAWQTRGHPKGIIFHT
ncbi:IS3 family transposase, partial [Acerihabitans sp. TG2]|uniref:IS3 family transposase n=1 Tax=Acerihabitans sp. TG2 TaxID=3096008 RepID=UPI002B22C409